MAIFVSTVVGLMLAASVVNAEQVKNYRMCQSEYCIIGHKLITYKIIHVNIIRLYSVFFALLILFHCFFFIFSDTNCDVYDLFVDPCPEALENQACELPQTENASIAFKYKPSMYN